MYQLPSDGLSFEVVKHGRETEQLVLRTLLLPSETSPSPPTTTISSATADLPRQRVHVLLTGIGARPEGPLSGWTLEQRVFDIAPSQAPTAIVLADSLPAVGQSSTCAIVLDEDLKPGTYQLRVRHVDPPEATALVSLYRVRPPEPSRREVNLSHWVDPDLQPRTRPAERVRP
jgi:hypothetical protein